MNRSPLTLSPIKIIEDRCRSRLDAISLAQGIPYFSVPLSAYDFVSDHIARGDCNQYSEPSGMPLLRDAILERTVGGLDSGGAIVTCGAIEGLSASLLAVLGAGDEVIIPSPTYPSFERAVRLAHAKPVSARLDASNGFSLDTAEVVRNITKRTKAIFFAHPNNPTGTTYSRDTLKKLVEIAHRENILLISDETYRDFTWGSEPFVSPADLPGGFDKTITVTSFSKSYGLTGSRVGALVAPKKVVDTIAPVHDTLVNCASLPSQYMALWCLDHGDATRKDNKLLVRKSVLELYDLLNDTELEDSDPPPLGAYYLFPRTPRGLTGDEYAQELFESIGVGVVPGEAFGPGGENRVRLCAVRKPQLVKEAISRLRSRGSESAPSRRQNLDFPHSTK